MIAEMFLCMIAGQALLNNADYIEHNFRNADRIVIAARRTRDIYYYGTPVHPCCNQPCVPTYVPVQQAPQVNYNVNYHQHNQLNYPYQNNPNYQYCNNAPYSRR